MRRPRWRAPRSASVTSGVSMNPNRARTECTFGISSSTHARAARSWRGVRRISRFRITIRSWHTWLCSRLRSSAVGTKPLWLTRNTAVPGTRVAFASRFGKLAPRHRALAQLAAQPRAAVAPGDEAAEHQRRERAAAPSRRSRSSSTLPSRNATSTSRNTPNTATICSTRPVPRGARHDGAETPS